MRIVTVSPSPNHRMKTGTQANAFRKFVKESGAPIEIVYDQGIPTETTNYTVIINNINNTQPDAVIHFGYAPNDIAFLRNVADVGIKFKMLFSIYAGLETELLEKNVGTKGLEHVFTYVPPSEVEYPVNFGMNLKDYKAAWEKKYPDDIHEVPIKPADFKRRIIFGIETPAIGHHGQRRQYAQADKHMHGVQPGHKKIKTEK